MLPSPSCGFGSDEYPPRVRQLIPKLGLINSISGIDLEAIYWRNINIYIYYMYMCVLYVCIRYINNNIYIYIMIYYVLYILYQLKTGAEAPHCMFCHLYDLFLELLYLLRSPASHAPSSREKREICHQWLSSGTSHWLVHQLLIDPRLWSLSHIYIYHWFIIYYTI